MGDAIRMNTYLVRTNCEYSLEVEARSKDEALALAGQKAVSSWGQAWAPMEIDDDD